MHQPSSCAAVVAFAAVLGTVGIARAAADCLTDFDTQSALAELEAEEPGGSLIPDYYAEPCTSSVRMHFEDLYYGHFHLTYADKCMGPQLTESCWNWDEYNFNCGGSPPDCREVDVTEQERYLTAHQPDASVTATILPSPGQTCIPDGGTGYSCKTMAGKWVAPRLFRGTPTSSAGSNANARLYGRYYQIVSYGTPAGTRYTLVAVNQLIKDNMVPGTTYTMSNSRSYDKLWARLVTTNDINKIMSISNFTVSYQ